jgi:hypothetical protein
VSEGRAPGARDDELEEAPEPVLDASARAIAARLAALPDVPAPSGWQAAVLEALPEEPPAAGDQPRPEATRAASPAALPPNGVGHRSRASLAGRSRARRWAMGAVAASAVAMAVALALWLRRPESSELRELGKPELIVMASGGVRATPVTGRAALGDVLRVEVTAPADSVLRLYRDDREVMLECPSAAPQCAQRARGLAVEFTLTAPGFYRAVVFRPAERARGSVGDLQQDLAGCDCETSMSVALTVQ